MLTNILSSITLHRVGAEIGGPSTRGDILYKNNRKCINNP